MNQELSEQRRSLPDQTGVYLFKDADGEVVYVGKARSIRKRVASHFTGGGGSVVARSGEVTTIDFMVTDTEAEALLTEQQFVHRYRPKFNVRLRDDKSYPYIGISLDEEYPRVYFTRENHRSSRLYFGPYADARQTRQTLDLLGKLFQYRTCDGPQPGRRSGVPCLDYYIKRCQAPCVDFIDRDEYRRNIDAIIEFLGGRYREVERDLEAKMNQASEAEEFERAATFRDRLQSVRSLMERKSIPSRAFDNADVIGVATADGAASAQVFQVRDGILAERQGFYLENAGEASEAEVAEQFLAQYYSVTPVLPNLIVVGPSLVDRIELLAEALSLKRGTRVEVRVAERGDKRRLRELAERNAKLALTSEQLRRERTRRQRVDAVSELRECLGMESLPMRIEGFDISNLGPTHTVASMVVFESGAPKKSDYRKFNVRGNVGEGRERPDDFDSMREILERRVAAYEKQNDLSPHDENRDPSFSSLPDLILIDGGKGQLGAGMKVLAPLIERGVTVISLAKRIEEVFVPGRSKPIHVPPDSEALRLLQRVRDEAHRFAITFHRQRRDKSMTGSIFDSLAGVGPVRKRALLEHFGTPERFMEASADEIGAVSGIPGKLARDIHRQLHRIA